ncbi:MAG: bifunctional proline dehydrogenase/L-glutamate gamma-semialdehyde dehydrogenase PutA [Wenzhouxiangellaceae bacterium]
MASNPQVAPGAALPAFALAEYPQRSELWRQMNAAWLTDESEHVRYLLEQVPLDAASQQTVREQAIELVRGVRRRSENTGAIEAFMQEYDLSSEEGVVLMCLAEALLRIPDADTAEKLIADKLADADWESHLGKSSSLFVNASTWGLMLTGKLVRVSESTQRNFSSVLARLANRSGEPVVRLAVRQAMRIMGHQFVMGRTIKEALQRSRKSANQRYRYSFDMLGEAALTAPDAQRYFTAYSDAIKSLAAGGPYASIHAAPSISVKLSALHPRYEQAQRERVMRELPPLLLQLAQIAAEAGIGLTVDAEESERLPLSLEIFAAVAHDPSIAHWQGLGLAVQAYQKRAFAALDWLAALAQECGRRFPVRLVKGAYWDTEIKLAQVEGWPGYPVFTRKSNTDLSYLACADRIFHHGRAFYPQFATHNAHTIAAIAAIAQHHGVSGQRTEADEAPPFEYQRLHGMGEDLYAEVHADSRYVNACRVYAPVGSHEDLLPYLVRRLLENGANTSFVNRVTDDNLPVEEVVEDPLAQVRELEQIPHPAIAQPRHLYGERLNSAGILWADEQRVQQVQGGMNAEPLTRSVGPRLAKSMTATSAASLVVRNPAALDQVIGQVTQATAEQAAEAVAAAQVAFPAWQRTPAEQRAAILERAADALEEHRDQLLALLTREAGKTLRDGIAEVREAADFCRYYALQARRQFGAPLVLPGPTGEHNQLSLHGRGVFVCISPWNFPLAIFTGQVAAALAAGNTVIAKPAEQTPLIAAAAVELLQRAGVPAEALQLLPGDGPTVGGPLTADERIAGVAFTGSTETARLINRTLAGRDGPLAVLIAETGGQNAMLVDSSALPEQVVKDVIASAFHSAGQRCSALRILCLQEDVADHMIAMLAGAMQELTVGDPGLLATDVGPVIDSEALGILRAHEQRMEKEARLIARAPLPVGLNGHFFAPVAFEIPSLDVLQREVFGPVLHVLRYRSRDVNRLIDAINATGYGLTMGVHSRIDRTQHEITQRVNAGNAYVNRNIVGAVVGVQPFGGEGLSGTGPKAGGPHYLPRFATERTLTVNTAAVGGNAHLLSLSE